MPPKAPEPVAKLPFANDGSFLEQFLKARRGAAAGSPSVTRAASLARTLGSAERHACSADALCVLRFAPRFQMQEAQAAQQAPPDPFASLRFC